MAKTKWLEDRYNTHDNRKIIQLCLLVIIVASLISSWMGEDNVGN